MLCPSCKNDNPDHAKFCLHCGTKLLLTCAECRTELPLGAKFCLYCGTSVVDTPADHGEQVTDDALTTTIQRLVPQEYVERLREAGGRVSRERRLVTILFSDVKGSTAMAENLDPEEVMEIMDGAFEVLIEPVYKYEGTLARLMGDAVLAFFGAPISHEDDPERAIRAGLEIVAGAKEFG
jgi:class 3 adenylate cyclase/ribosomal protein L40E